MKYNVKKIRIEKLGDEVNKLKKLKERVWNMSNERRG